MPTIRSQTDEREVYLITVAFQGDSTRVNGFLDLDRSPEQTRALLLALFASLPGYVFLPDANELTRIREAHGTYINPYTNYPDWLQWFFSQHFKRPKAKKKRVAKTPTKLPQTKAEWIKKIKRDMGLS